MPLSKRSLYYGRRQKLTADIRGEILQAVTAGVPRKIAARLAGVSGNTLAGWLALGRAGDEELGDFLTALKAAEKAVAAKRKGDATAQESHWNAVNAFMERRLAARPLYDPKELEGLRERLDAIEVQLKARRQRRPST